MHAQPWPPPAPTHLASLRDAKCDAQLQLPHQLVAAVALVDALTRLGRLVFPLGCDRDNSQARFGTRQGCSALQ